MTAGCCRWPGALLLPGGKTLSSSSDNSKKALKLQQPQKPFKQARILLDIVTHAQNSSWEGLAGT